MSMSSDSDTKLGRSQVYKQQENIPLFVPGFLFFLGEGGGVKGIGADMLGIQLL